MQITFIWKPVINLKEKAKIDFQKGDGNNNNNNNQKKKKEKKEKNEKHLLAL